MHVPESLLKMYDLLYILVAMVTASRARQMMGKHKLLLWHLLLWLPIYL